MMRIKLGSFIVKNSKRLIVFLFILKIQVRVQNLILILFLHKLLSYTSKI